MSDQTFFYWGVLVSMFLFFAAVLTIRQVLENMLNDRATKNNDSSG
jgi:hypothetical protein